MPDLDCIFACNSSPIILLQVYNRTGSLVGSGWGYVPLKPDPVMDITFCLVIGINSEREKVVDVKTN
jgi:hypothetical protein